MKKNKEISRETKLTNEPLRNLYIKIDTNKTKKVNNHCSIEKGRDSNRPPNKSTNPSSKRLYFLVLSWNSTTATASHQIKDDTYKVQEKIAIFL